MTRFRVLVADDEPLARSMVAALVRADEEIDVVLECADSKTAQDLIRQERPDIVFLDIEMPEVTGLDVARELTEEGPVVVFVTAFSRYAPEAFEVNASDYVLKPFSDRRFTEALHRAKRRVRERRLGQPARKQEHAYAEHLSFRHDDRTIVIKTADVSWIEAEDYYVRIHSNLGRHLVRTALATLEARLNPREFLRVHRSAIVNMQKVADVRDTGTLTLVLTDGTEIPVSRSKKAGVESALLPFRKP